MSEISNSDGENFSFGMLLRSFRTRAGFSQKELAQLIDLDRSGTLGQWERGQLPGRSLDRINEIIQVLELNESEAQTLRRALAIAIKPLQRPRKAPPLLRFVPPLPDHAVERALATLLIDALTQRAATGAVQNTAVILSGLAGIGKATLAKQIAAEPDIQLAFPAGVLWLHWRVFPPETDFERWCNALGVQRAHRLSWQEAWFKWLRELEKAALLILDDVSGSDLRRSWLGELLKALPENATVLITTQDGDAVMNEVQHWRASASVQSFVLGGLNKTEAYALATTVLDRIPTAAEWAALQTIGAALGWHPEALRLAASAPTALQDTAITLSTERSLQRISTLLNAQWMRLQQSEQEQLLRLVGHAKVSGVFGRGYAAAVWQISPEEAKCQLERLVSTGFIERVTEVHDPLWPWPADYRVMPAAQRFLKSRVWTRKDTARDLLHATPAVLRAVRHLQSHGGAWLRPPWQFRLVAFFWQILFLAPKAIILALLRLAQALGAPRRWFETWRDWTMLLFSEKLLRSHWAKRGIEPPEEFWLIYDAHQGKLLWIAVLGILPLGIGESVFGLISLSLSVHYPLFAQRLNQVYLALLLALLVPIVWYFWSMPWRYWIVRHYGVVAWDLQLLVRLTRFLGAKEVEYPHIDTVNPAGAQRLAE